MPVAPAPLPENLPFAFRGERVEPARALSAAAAQRLRAALNLTGKPNADVLREFLGVTPRGHEQRRSVVDFPAGMTAREAALYSAPFAALAEAGAPLHNPQRDDALRNALARIDRFLACPAVSSEPSFLWIEGDVLPDDSLIVWARNDDFSAGVLASRAFALWCARAGGVFAGLRSFPFPWPPATPLSALSRVQEEQRFAMARTARAEDSDALETAFAQAYGWPADLDDEGLLAHLAARHDDRVRSGR